MRSEGGVERRGRRGEEGREREEHSCVPILPGSSSECSVWRRAVESERWRVSSGEGAVEGD